MIDISEQTIVLEDVLKSKMGDKARYVPGFLVSYLKRIIHQDWLNKYIWDARDLVGSPWLKGAIDYLNVTIKVEGQENLPDPNDGKFYTFVSNHPLGGIDGVSIGAVLGEHYNDNFRYLVNDLLMNLPGLAPLCIPVNKTGHQARSFPAMVDAGFKAPHHMLMFPAGLCSRRRNGEIKDLEWKKTFIVKSVETQRDVVPIHFIGQNSDFFYRLSNISDRLVKKVNIAMLYLVDEMYKNQGQTFTIRIGKPIPWQTFDHSKTPNQWAAYVKEQVYNI
jgi:putative hemolysin